MRIGVTGHQRLDEPSQWRWVEDQIEHLLSKVGAVVGVSSLAIGSDQLFASVVLRMSGTLHVVLPFSDYERTFAAEDLEPFRSLLGQARQVETLPAKLSDEESFLAAGERVADLSELLVAIWNGRPAAGLGGTADIVDYAARRKIRLIHMNPVERAIYERTIKAKE
jgi:hypothetical protein